MDRVCLVDMLTPEPPGIYPREPRNKKKASKSSTPNTTFYYTKDIQYLLHEPLLAKFREQKAVSKKIARSLGRNEVGDAARLEKNGMPKISLDHLVKERYPTFVDALRDLDDALSLLFLFANLPSTTTVPPKTIALCQRLCLEFQHYLITTHSLRKSFLSIKGIYYQATIQGQDIMWLVPYRFVQRVTGDVDYRIMGTFVEFYTTLLGFVNFRLYNSIGLIYPPKFDAASDEKGAELTAFTLEGKKIGGEETKALTGSEKPVSSAVQAKVDSVVQQAEADKETNGDEVAEAEEEVDDEAIDTFETEAPDADTLPQPTLSGNEAASLFAPFTVFISREAPRAPLEFLLRSFGCKRIAWDGVLGEGAFTTDESDPRITHQIVDRPQLPQSSLPPTAEGDEAAVVKPKSATRIPGRTYIQPQWVWDCVNEGKLLRPDLYAPGATLPPHLSPWVKPTKGMYDPRATLEEQEAEGEAELAEEEDSEEEEEDEDEEMEEAPAVKSATKKSKTADIEEDEEDEEDEDSDVDSVGSGMRVDLGDDVVSDSESSEEEEDEELGDPELEDSASDSETETARTTHQAELEAEAAGLPFSKSASKTSGAKGKKAQSELAKKMAAKKKKEEEELERQKMMMSRKKRKLLEKMLHGNEKKETEAAKLRAKRRKIEKAEKAAKAL